MADTAGGALGDTGRDLPPDPEYKLLLDSLGFEPAPVDVLCERTGLTVEVISSMLLTLELQGTVSSAPGRGYARMR
ncbi:MAG: DNA processing protein [Candidatus Kentron sp. G]|nr:MAG: DNA processing protein [Candidatus Kentron sp. G]VFM96594.1 MAG: DNA processing protein [Candidatus Kentron sp. G]